MQLIVQFLEQASKPSVNEQNQVQPPPDNKRNRILKLLALKVAAHLKWDLDVLEKRYSLYTFMLSLLNLSGLRYSLLKNGSMSCSNFIELKFYFSCKLGRSFDPALHRITGWVWLERTSVGHLIQPLSEI